MLFGRVATWEHDVFPAWRRSANNALRPNSDVWGNLPQNVCWLVANIDDIDTSRLYVIGSSDWMETFGTYKVQDIAAKPSSTTDDKYKHNSRIKGIGVAYSLGKNLEPIILVCHSGEGPFVVVDGNHRAVAMQKEGLLVGKQVFVGMHARMGTEFNWFGQSFPPV